MEKIFEINVTGTLRGIQTCAPLIRESGGGSIVNIGSVAGITGNFSTGYSSSKWALEGLSRSAAYVYADWGIRCNVIQPGFIETDLTASMSSNPIVKKMASRAMNNTVLLRRSGKADEIAFTALFLASDESSYITGTDIVVPMVDGFLRQTLIAKALYPYPAWTDRGVVPKTGIIGPSPCGRLALR